MKRLLLVCVMATVAASAQAQPTTYLDNAPVLRVEPQIERVAVPRQECRREWVSETRRVGRHDRGGLVLGAVTGAVVGNQFGRGQGREAATALGAVVGALAGDSLGHRDRWVHDEPVLREVTSCRTVDEVQSRIVGYQVTYEHQGRRFTTLMSENPGPYVQVRVSVDLVSR
ncbi:MAG: hypothetical protein RL375_4506 [Pseudomonadota bacterium]